MIPKKIHYCWFGKKPLPALVRKCIETWKTKLPEFEIVLWNEKNSPMKHPFVKAAYEAKKYAFVSDYVRLWALEKNGGVYLDTDMFVIKDFKDILSTEVFFAWEDAQKLSLSCGVIGCLPGNNFIRAVLKKYDETSFTLSQIDDLVIPRLVTQCYSSYLSKDTVSVYPYDYFYPFPFSEKYDLQNFRKYQTANTYAIHLWNLSWVSKGMKLKIWIYTQLKPLLIKLKLRGAG